MRIALVSILLLSGVWGCFSCKEATTVVEPWYAPFNANGDPVFAVFQNRIPCPDCEKIKFALALYRHHESKTPTTFAMALVYVGKGNERTINEGTWTITHEMNRDSAAIVYRLDSHAPAEFQSFWAIGQDLLFILDEEMNPRVGDAGYGYVLNRVH